MKEAPYRDMMHEQDSAQKIRKDRADEGYFGEGADVGGPRWRIGWGGLIHDNDNDDQDRDDHD
jgi:hypothetical protein